MAGRALGLYVCVPADDFARHHERLNGLSSSSVAYEAGEQRNKSFYSDPRSNHFGESD